MVKKKINYSISLKLGGDSLKKEEALNVIRASGFLPEISDEAKNGDYVNLIFKVSDKKGALELLHQNYLSISYFANNSIIVCEGDNSWDDYLLLYHYDKSEELNFLE